jgi:hypothetical protein
MNSKMNEMLKNGTETAQFYVNVNTADLPKENKDIKGYSVVLNLPSICNICSLFFGKTNPYKDDAFYERVMSQIPDVVKHRMYKPDVSYRQHIIALAERLGDVIGCETTLLDGYNEDDYKMVIVCAFSILQNWVFSGLYFYRSKHLTAAVVKDLSRKYDKKLITKEQMNLNHINYMGAFNLLDNLARRFGEDMDKNGFKPYQMKLFEDEQGKVQQSEPDKDWYNARIADRPLCSFTIAISSIQVKTDNFEDTLVFHFDIGYSFQRIISCVICDEKTLGYGHNALPVADGRCCDKCNAMEVIPARMRLLEKKEHTTCKERLCPNCIKVKNMTAEEIAEAEAKRQEAEAELLNLKPVAEKKEKPKTKAQLQAEETRRANAALKAEKKRKEDYEKQVAEVSARNAQKKKNKQKEIAKKKREHMLKCMGVI